MAKKAATVDKGDLLVCVESHFESSGAGGYPLFFPAGSRKRGRVGDSVYWLDAGATDEEIQRHRVGVFSPPAVEAEPVEAPTVPSRLLPAGHPWLEDEHSRGRK